jgi:hypothetical protein
MGFPLATSAIVVCKYSTKAMGSVVILIGMSSFHTKRFDLVQQRLAGRVDSNGVSIGTVIARRIDVQIFRGGQQ